ncbi:hypothetical protein MPSEU_000204800 [Mayamaea pseudoterrestris]|nr:hypothetical protein MPSEU_000204800 [Mayamaea pseudoterrestris]
MASHREGATSLQATNTRTPPASLPSTMDDKLSKVLSSDDFSVSSYLNLALWENDSIVTVTNNEHLSQQMTELALQLQLQTQACHEDIGRIGAELQAILPRCAADMSRISLGLDGLRLDAKTLLGAACVDGDTDVSSSLETLTMLHALQANLSRTKEILLATATWDTIVHSVNEMLAAQNLSEAVTALAQLAGAERALKGMPQPEQRQQQIDHIRHQVSAMLAPQLKHALANMNTRIAPLQQCVALYTKLHKIDVLKEEYVKNRPLVLHKAWFEYTPPNYKEGQSEVSIKSHDFAAWLPGWFDAVLSLLTEERRQCMAVFGAELVPEILIKVLSECFRPISTSFKSRLETVCSSDPSTPTHGSLEKICSIFESTLQFLSLVYEAISGSWLDLVEAGTLPTDSGLELYKSIVHTFLVVAAPFATYQERLAQLEANYSGELLRNVAQEIRDAAALKDSSIESLQLATERLTSLSGAFIPIVVSAISRFELLTGGYSATQFLASMDNILAENADELALAVHSLSDALLNDAFADSFDDSHVIGALEVLKIAGIFFRNMQSLEKETRERLLVLAGRQSINACRESEVEGIARQSKSLGFDFPDSMSAVEIDCVITKTICGQAIGADNDASIELAHRLGLNGEFIFAQVGKAKQRLASSCQAFVFGVLVAVPRRHLKSVPSMPSWRESVSSDDFSFGILPQQYITLVGEHMLALVQTLEPFASDRQSLSLAHEAMTGVREIALSQWHDLMKVCSCNVDSCILRTLMDGKELSARVMLSVSLDDEDINEVESDESIKASTAFCNSWLDVVGLAVTGQLLENITRIPSLSSKGCEHLAADLDYLVNVFSALGVQGHPHPMLGHVGQLAIIDSGVLAERIASFDRDDEIALALVAIEERIAAIRIGGAA